MQPSVSVLIPVYNAKLYLKQCLQSVSAQTYKHFEIICINDGSTDESAQCLRSYARQEPRLRCITQSNKGVAATRNRLLQEAKGKYITFLDADDWWEPDFLEKMYTAAEQSQANLTKCFFKQFDDTKQQFQTPFCSSKFTKQPTSDMVSRLQAGYSDAVVWGKLYARSWILEQQFRFLTGQVAEDTAFSAMAFLGANKITIIPEKLYIHRKEGKTHITSNKEKMDIGCLHNRLYLCDEISRRGWLLPEVADQLLRYVIADLARLRKMPIATREQYMLIIKRAVIYLRRDKDFCTWYGRLRINLFLCFARKPVKNAFYYWAKLFR